MFNLIESKINDIEKPSPDEDAASARRSKRVESLGLLNVAPLAVALKKRRGRPALGKPTPVVMDTHEEDIARQMGGGVKSFGVRMALRAVQMMGIENARHLAAQYVVELGGGEAAPSSASASTTVKHLIRKTASAAMPAALLPAAVASAIPKITQVMTGADHE